MKTKFLMAAAIVLVTGLTVTAQLQRVQSYSPQGVRQMTRPEGFSMPLRNLDEKQREEMQKIRTEQMKASTQFRNLLREKRAKLEVLQTADKPDMKEINKVIDEIAAVQAQEMKAKAANRQKIRSLLTEEQRVQFDAMGANRENNMRQGNGNMRSGAGNLRPGMRNMNIERGVHRPPSAPGNDHFRVQRPERPDNM